jgi:hypothetical protein
MKLYSLLVVKYALYLTFRGLAQELKVPLLKTYQLKYRILFTWKD